MTAYDIDYINTTEPTVDYSLQAVSDYKAGLPDSTDHYTLRFEQEHNVTDGLDIGGLMVYNDGSAVYDYENFCGWVRS
jgi:hypothetical protein